MKIKKNNISLNLLSCNILQLNEQKVIQCLKELNMEIYRSHMNWIVLKNEVLPGIDVEADSFWSAFEKILQEFGGRNKALLDKRKEIQKQIDEWHISRKGEPHNQDEYIEFLKKIDYLIDEGEDFEITTTNVDLSLIHI